MKIQFTILLFFICTCNLLANRLAEANTPDDLNTTVVAQGNDTGAMSPSNITDEGSGGGLSSDKESINSILGYSILIFFSVLIIILIDNRNLERRYKKLATDFKNKEPFL
ncbi:hypothetical protein U8527_17825 [Kordia algicida OT-1]|uniref:Uncharacterized protein n=1 Tax=Kordia algicida OT-1 TaxID=391587 RepID=A9DI77_9FLAO|nr:hypothetical protein [Kordia algicida]EDP97850.1 hypothetical protein KAOT1_11572 [Kordia algicida OT-1]